MFEDDNQPAQTFLEKYFFYVSYSPNELQNKLCFGLILFEVVIKPGHSVLCL